MKKTYLLILPALVVACSGNYPTEAPKETTRSAQTIEEQQQAQEQAENSLQEEMNNDFGTVKLPLTQVLDGKTYKVTGRLGLYILNQDVKPDVNGDLPRLFQDPWWEVPLRLNDGEFVNQGDIIPNTPIEIAPIGDLTCYVDDAETPCVYKGYTPKPLYVFSNSESIAQIMVEIQSEAGPVTVLCGGGVQIQLVVTQAAGDACPRSDRAYVSFRGSEPYCTNRCGGSCNNQACGNSDCNAGELCVIPTEPTGSTYPGYCIKP